MPNDLIPAFIWGVVFGGFFGYLFGYAEGFERSWQVAKGMYERKPNGSDAK